MQLYNYRKKRKRRRFRWAASGHEIHHYRKRHEKKSGKNPWKVLVIVLICLAAAAGAGVGGFALLRQAGKTDLMKYAGDLRMTMASAQDESGLVSKNGKKYRYKEGIITLLCMGIDQGSEAWGQEAAQGENGQADTIFLLVLDEKGHSLKLIGISRDTMTKIRTFDRQGNEVGESVNHLALAFSYGKTKEEGAVLVKDAVSQLFYDLPIHGYAAIDWNALGKLNDSVGGVLVTLPQDMNLGGTAYYSGEKVRLTGAQAQDFVRHRGEDLGSNNERMQRQKTYVSAFVAEAQKEIRRDPLLVADLYQELTADMVTSLGLNETVYLASLLPAIRFDTADIQMVEGTVRQGARYEEFYVDEEKLMEMILEIFYQEV